MINTNKIILLVEDDESLRELVTMLLELEKYRVISCKNGQQAVTYLEEHDVDLMILDLFMPVLDGTQVLNWLRNEKKSSLPVLIMTAMTDDKTRQNMINQGANGFINKPLDVDTITQSVDRILNSLQ